MLLHSRAFSATTRYTRPAAAGQGAGLEGASGGAGARAAPVPRRRRARHRRCAARQDDMATAAAAASRLLLADGELKGHVLRLGEWLGRGDQSPRETEVKGEETEGNLRLHPHAQRREVWHWPRRRQPQQAGQRPQARQQPASTSNYGSTQHPLTRWAAASTHRRAGPAPTWPVSRLYTLAKVSVWSRGRRGVGGGAG